MNKNIKKFVGNISNNVYIIEYNGGHHYNLYLKGKLLFSLNMDYEDLIDSLNRIEPIKQIPARRTRVHICKGDILQYAEKVDAIVDATNTKLCSSFGVGYVVQKAAGKELQNELYQIGPQTVGTACITDSYAINTKYLIHTVSPDYIDGLHFEDEQLAICYENCLKCALENGVRSVAFPSISTGGKGFPILIAAKIAAKSIRTFILEHMEEIEDIVFVLYDENTYQIYNDVFKHMSCK